MNRSDLPVLTEAEAARAQRHGHLDRSALHPGLFVLLANDNGATVARYVRVERPNP